MYSDSYEYYSDSSAEELNDQPSNIPLIYKQLTESLNDIIKRKPLINRTPLPDAIQSRITVLTELYDVISDRYRANIKRSWFRFKLGDLTEAIYNIAQLVDEMENKYDDLENSLDSAARCYVRLFPTPLDEYLDDTRRNIIQEFNDFISDDDWLVFRSTKETEMKLPLLNKLKIPKKIIQEA